MQYSKWLSSPAGINFIKLEKKELDKFLTQIFGYFALMLGESNYFSCLTDSKLTHKYAINPKPDNQHLISRFDKLAIASDVTDLLYLPHCLEFSNNQHEILREAYRVLRGDGRLIITMFNPFSFSGFWHQFSWETNFVSVQKLRDWLALLGFDIIRVNHFKMAYIVEASKRIIPLTPIRPVWIPAEDVVTNDLDAPAT